MNIDKNKVELYVNSIVRKYSNRGISDEELFNVGMQAALKVIDENKNNPNFDMLKDYRFNWFIRQAITRILNESIEDNISKDDIDLVNKYLKFLRKYRKENNKEPSEKDIINGLNINNSDLNNIKDIINEYNL